MESFLLRQAFPWAERLTLVERLRVGELCSGMSFFVWAVAIPALAARSSEREINIICFIALLRQSFHAHFKHLLDKIILSSFLQFLKFLEDHRLLCIVQTISILAQLVDM